MDARDEESEPHTLSHAGARSRPLSLFRLRDDVLILWWQGEMPASSLAEAREAVDALSQSTPRKFSLFHLVSPEVPLLNDDARSTFTGIMRSYRERIACIGVLLAGAGFWASVMQSVSTGMRLLAGVSFQLLVSGDEHALTANFVKEHYNAGGEPLDVETLRIALDEVRTPAAHRLNQRTG